MDGFSPFYQEHLYPILSSLLKENGFMYIVGQEPYKMPIDEGNFEGNDAENENEHVGVGGFENLKLTEFEPFDISLPFEILRLRDSV